MVKGCLINGNPADLISVSDRGLHYGDGLFETLAVNRGVCEFWDQHLLRLQLGCQRLRIPAPDPDILAAEAGQLIAGQTRAVLKIIITRGAGGRGYQAPQPVLPTRILRLSEWREHPTSHADIGIQIRICGQRLSRNPLLAGLKHLNRLEQVLARLEWDNPDIVEGLMLDDQDRVIEGTFTNLFLVEAGQLITPPVDQCGVAGILRDVVSDLADSCGLVCKTQSVTLARLQDADELFLTNSLIGIWPVRSVEKQIFEPGTVTRRLQNALLERRQMHGLN